MGPRHINRSRASRKTRSGGPPKPGPTASVVPMEGWGRLFPVVVTVGVLLGTTGVAAETSSLWGEDGEAFDPTGRLMDWSYAGYRAGELPLPELAPTHLVTDFGAIADDGQDDTAAIVAALAAAAREGGGVVGLPPGRLLLSERVRLEDGVVVQGAGLGVTTVFIPVSLTDVYGNDGLDSGGSSSYAFSGGFFEVRGNTDNDALTEITAGADRGTTTIEVASAEGLSIGEWVRVVQTDQDRSLMNRLHADLLEAGDDNVGDRGMNFHTRIAAIEGSTIELERALPVDIDPGWAPRVHPVTPTVQEVGIESLTIEFPLTTYPGHFDEQGYNGIDISEANNGWVRDVEVVNADYGVNIRRSEFMTITGVVLRTSGDRGALSGHHGLNNGHGDDNLFIDFDIQTTMIHDLTNEWYATGVVFTRGRGDDLRMDHHRAAPYSTLWTELDCGAGQSPFVSGGRSDRGPHTAAYDTLWNVTASAPMEFPEDDFGPRINYVGFRTDATEVTSPYDWWFEAIAPEALEPPNLWEAMVERRLGDPPGGGSESGTDGGTASGADETSGDGEGSGNAQTDGATTGDGTGPGTGGGDSTGAGTDPQATGEEPGGCSCRTTAPDSAWWALLFMLPVLRQRS